MNTKHIIPLVLLSALLIGANLHAQIFVTNYSSNAIMEYNLNGTPVGTGTLVSGEGLDSPYAITISGSDIFVANWYSNAITEYTIADVPVGTGTLVSGNAVGEPKGIAVSGSDIFVTSVENDTISEYTTSGSLVRTLAPGGEPWGIAVIPEPSTWALLAMGGAGLVIFALRRSRARA